MSPSIIPDQMMISVYRYRVHIFIFLVTLFIALTLAHPAVLLNDEFITTNQLRQLHAGHQIVINEGKYGMMENGSMGGYFWYKSNVLGYSLFLPLLSLPAHWIIDLSGEHCVYLIICLWTMILLLLILFIHHFFREFSFFGRLTWTPYAIIVIFILFFLNLFFYAAFPVDTINNFPEVLAIVFTNIVLLALTAILIYEINRTIFENPAFSFFGTMVCLFSSSYFLWATHCKDHILVLPIFTAIFLCLIRLTRTEDLWYLPLAFLFSGLLAWARPELALWMFLLICGICGHILIYSKSWNQSRNDHLFILCSPLFTAIGALPFFLNNYLITKNILLPTQSLYLPNVSTPLGMNATQPLIPSVGVKSTGSVIMQFVPTIPPNPFDFLNDLAGVFFYPQTGNISIFTIIPFFLLMSIIAGVLLAFRKIQFSVDERKFIVISVLVSAAVFLTYTSLIHLLNTDFGITPDIRYLSPMYLPLTVTGLIVLKKTDILQENPVKILKTMFLIGFIGLPLSMILLNIAFTFYIPNFMKGIIPLGKFFNLYTLVLIAITLGSILYCKYQKWGKEVYLYLVLLICSIPFFWQVNAVFVYRTFSGFAGYTFWIPEVRVIWELIIKFILFKG